MFKQIDRKLNVSVMISRQTQNSAQVWFKISVIKWESHELMQSFLVFQKQKAAYSMKEGLEFVFGFPDEKSPALWQPLVYNPIL